MIYTLENEFLEIIVSDHGAELHSVHEKSDGTEYLWHGDPSYWKYRSPILFPIVGKLKDGKYRIEGKTYELPAHGLGRISDFALTKQSHNTLEFELLSSDESLEVYPFSFSLKVSYKLCGKRVVVSWDVHNNGTDTMFFSIGAHPAFMCPIDPSDQLENCFLEFEQSENLSTLVVTSSGYLSHSTDPISSMGKQLPLSADIFQYDTLIFHKLNSDSISIQSHSNDKVLRINAPGFPFWGIWSPEKGKAPFICLEPWYGHADYEDFDGEFKEKDDNLSLMSGDVFKASYEIEIGK